MNKLKSLLVFVVIILQVSFVCAQESKEITLRDIWAAPTFYPQSIDEIRSMENGIHYCILKKNEIIKYEYKNGKEIGKVLSGEDLKAASKEKIRIDDYHFSKDETKILFSTETERIYRHSRKSEFFVFDLETKKLTKLSDGGKQRLAEFSPDGNLVAFVRENNIFIKNINSGKEEQITTDGKDRHIINGTMDWVYEEEFAITKGFNWSPNGKFLAYFKFDESEVKEFWMTYYGELYPEKYKYKYPKAGEDNSVVTIHTYNLETKRTVEMDIGDKVDQYIPRIAWTNSPVKLCITRMNRLQNKLELLLADAKNGNSEVIFTEENKYYIDEMSYKPTFLANNEFLRMSEKDGFYHIYLYDNSGKEKFQLTKGEFDVKEIVGVNEEKQLVYFLSYEKGPQNSLLYSVGFDGENKLLISKRLGWNDVEMSNNFKYYINTYSTANTPPVYTLNTINGDEKRVLEDNSDIALKMKEYNFSKLEFFNFKTTEDVNLNGWMIKPPSFDETKKYPVFMYVYGGPGSQTVNNEWGYFNFVWFQMLAQKGYIVVSVDNRGTGGRGEEFKKSTYLKLGNLETKDQIEAAKWLGHKGFVDSDRIGIFGWSYGGYMSTLCLTKGANYFKSAIAVAPVTNWRYYDNIYTERFMRTPQENGTNYDANSPISHVKKMKGNYLLVHGTTDDNVHVQNTYDLITALVNANKQFDMQLYPNKNHGIYGGYTRYHLYKKMTDFILEKL
jgi:dipeptidyl-peptidase-4